jgi:hypothetical protein
LRQRILLGVLAVLAVVSWRLSAQNAARMAVPPLPEDARPDRAGVPERPAAPAARGDTKITRNPFEYGGGSVPRETRPPRTPAPAGLPREVAEPTPPRVRLVGVVRPPAGGARAALSVDGEVLLLAPGGSADGYTLLEILDDQGVRLRTPSGEEVTVTASR